MTETSTTNVRSSTFTRFGRANKFKIVVLSYMATRISDVQNLCKPFSNAAKLFKEHDRNHDGCLEYEEVGMILRKVGFTDEKEIERLIRAIDTDRNGLIHFNEFLAASIHPNVYSSKNRIEAAFNLFDVERRGKISLANVQKAVKDLSISEAEWNAMVEELDKQGHGQLTF